ncbi:MAG: hypothetical protein ACI4AB_05090 [Acetatifactor sp.]
MEKNRRELWLKAVAAGLVLGSFLINIKNILTSCHVDAEYQVAMAYRMLRGDRMFSQMWESHQTSAFFLAFFEWIYLKLTGTTTGIVLYANAVGILCRTVVAFLVFKTMKKYIDKRAAFAILLLALNLYPKDVMLPDFANMQIWFALLLMCCLITYFEGSGKKVWLVAGAVCLCLEVLSYPSCVLVWIPCVILIGMYSPRKKRDFGIFTGVCAASGMVWLLYFMRGEPKKFVQYIYEIWSGDESHAVGPGVRLRLLGQDFAALAGDLKYFFVMALCALLFSCIVGMLYRKKGSMLSRKRFWLTAFSWFVGIYVFAYLVHLPAEEAGTKYHFFALYFFVEIAAFLCMRYLNAQEKRIFLTGQLIGFGGFAATLFLSDCGLFTTIPYMIPNLCVSLIPLEKAWQGAREEMGKREPALLPFAPVALLCAVMIFRNAVYVNGWMVIPANFKEDSIFGVTWTAHYGPLKGIVSREGTYVADVSYSEWQELIQPGDKVLILSYPSLTATTYLYEDVEICADSVISTPTYSERMLTYWEENPDKYPDVVVVKCYGGTVMAGGDNPVMEWLTEEFNAEQIVDGAFWRYYLKNSAE